MAKKRKTVTQAAMEKKEEEKKQEKKKERISPREAATAASRYYNELTNSAQLGSIEEIELSEDENRWIVTLGFLDTLAAFGPRVYKLFEVDARTGEVLSMRIRNV